MSPNLERKLKIVLSTFILSGLFLFVSAPKTTLAYHSTTTYNKEYNGTLTASEWNDLFSDFVNSWLPTSMNGPLGIATSAPASGLEVYGPIKASSFTGSYLGTLSAGNVSSGAFGLNTGGGNYSFPGNLGIGTTTPTAALYAIGNAVIDLPSSGSATFVESPAGATSAGKINLGRSADGYESISFDPTLGTAGNFVFTAPLLVSASSPGITFFDPDDPSNTTLQRSIEYDPDTLQLQIGDSIKTNFSTETGGPPANKTFFQIGTRDLATPAAQGIFIGANTPAAFTGDLLHFQVGDNTRFRITKHGDIIAGGTTMTINGPVLNTSQTWNNAAVNFTAWTLNVTDTASVATSTLLNMRVGGVSKFAVKKSGNVGIGTLNPSETLELASGNVSLRSNGAIKLDNTSNNNPWYIGNQGLSSATLAFMTGGKGNDYVKMQLSGAGNLGIGTTTTSAKLYVDGTGYFTNTVTVGSPSQDSHAATKAYVDSVISGTSSVPTVGYWTKTGDDVYNANSGNIGIGTASPEAKLDVNSGTSNTVASFKSTDTTSIITFKDNTTSGNYLGIGASGDRLIFLNKDGTEKMSILDSGNVGIGTNVPDAPLHISKDLGTSNVDILNLENIDTTTGVRDVFVKFKHANQEWAVGMDDSNIDAFTIASGGDLVTEPRLSILSNSGNVGIGTTAPNYKLHVESADNNRILSKSTDADSSSDISVQNDAEQWQMKVNGDISDSFSIRDAAGDHRLVILPNTGNIGIGTTTPTTRLSVTANGNYSIFAGSARIGNVATPIADNDAATKSYVDSAAGGGVGAGTTGQTLRHDGSNWVANSTLFNNGTNVGIGTASPGDNLEILPSGAGKGITVRESDDGNEGISLVGYAGNGQLWAFADGVLTTRIHGSGDSFFNAGNVGIGTASPGAKLHVLNTNADQLWLERTGSITGKYRVGIAVATNSFSIFDEISQENRFVIDSSGNIGIGTISPGAKLDVDGKIYSANGLYGRLDANTYFGFTGADEASIYAGGIKMMEFKETTQNLVSINRDNADVDFRVDWDSGDGALFVEGSSGNIGIGTTTPAYKLDVNGTGQFTNTVVVATPTAGTHAATRDYVDSAAGGGVGAGTTGQTLRHDGSNWVANSTLFNNGTNVGIGTASPGAKLDVENPTTDTYTAEFTNSVTSVKLAGYGMTGADRYRAGYFYRNAGTTADGANVYIHNDGDADDETVLQLRGDGTGNLFSISEDDDLEDVLVVKSGGNVGIGTASPNTSVPLTISSAIPGIQFIDTDDVDWVMNADSDDYSIKEGVAGSSPDTRFIIKSGGNIGIGTTTPEYALDVRDVQSSYFSASIFVGTPTAASHAATKSYVDSAAGGGFTGSGTTNYVTKWTGTDALGNSVLYDDGTNVGIGTASPAGSLDIKSDGATALYLQAHSNTATFPPRLVPTRSRGTEASKTVVQDGDDIFYIRPQGYDGSSYRNVGEIKFGIDGVPGAGDMPGRITFSTTPNGSTSITERMRIDSTGNVGIGTTNPTYKLDVVGNIGMDEYLNHNGDSDTYLRFLNDAMQFRAGAISFLRFDETTQNIINFNWDNADVDFQVDTTAGDGAFFVRGSDGNVGIGTTTPTTRLSVTANGTYSIFAGSARIGNVATPVDPADAATKSYVDSAAGGGVGAGTTGQTLRHDGSNWVASSLLYNNGANVGIGTASPSSLLELSGDSKELRLTDTGASGGGSGNFVRFYQDDGATLADGDRMGELGFGGNNNAGSLYKSAGIFVEADGAWATNDYPSRMRFSTTPDGSNSITERMRITSDGNIGIGTNSPATLTHLYVNDTATLPQLTIEQDGTGDAGIRFLLPSNSWSIGADNSGGDFFGISNVNYGVDSSAEFVISQSGKVGIGTASPQFNLHLASGIPNEPVLFLENTVSAGADARVLLGDSVENYSYSIGLDDTGNKFAISYATTSNGAIAGVNDRLVIDNSGNVGIGTTTPVYALDVRDVQSSYFSAPLFVGTPTAASHATTKSYVDSAAGGGFTGSGTTNYVTKWTGTTALGNSVLYDDGTNVGIGTVSPDAKLQITDIISNGGGAQTVAIIEGLENGGDMQAGDGPRLLFKIPYNSQNSVIGASIDAVKQSAGDSITNTDLVFRISQDDETLDEAMRINSSGNVGIGTASPDRLLELEGNPAGIHIDSTANAFIDIDRAASSGNTEIRFSTNDVVGWVTGIGNNSLLGNGTAFFIGQTQGGASADLVIQTDGNVGINDTTPSYKLDVDGASQFTNTVIVATPTAGTHAATKDYVDSAAGGGVGAGTTGQTLRHDGSNWIANSALYNNGTNVGIGTTNPALGKLQIDTGDNTNKIAFTNGGAGRMYIKSVSSGTKNVFRTANNYDFEFQDDAGGDILFMDESSGNVGIGVASPGSNLHVLKLATAGGAPLEVLRLEVKDEGVGLLAGMGPKLSFYGPHDAASYESASISAQKEDGSETSEGTSLTFDTRINAGALTEKMRINSSGNVGIGTVSPSATLEIGSTDGVRGLALMDSGGGYGFSAVSHSTQGSYVQVYDDNHVTTIMLDARTDTGSRYSYFNAGNIGIGTTTPTTRLSVAANGTYSIFAGSARIGNVATPVDGADAATKSYVDSAAGGGVGAGTTGQTLRHDGSNWVANSVLYNNGTNVGIGTASPNELLSVGSSDLTSVWGGNVQIESDGNNVALLIEESGVGSEAWGLGVNNAGDLQFFDSGTASPRITFQDAGNVGIGTASPEAPLDTNGKTLIGARPVIGGDLTAQLGVHDNTGTLTGITIASGDANSIAGEAIIRMISYRDNTLSSPSGYISLKYDTGTSKEGYFSFMPRSIAGTYDDSLVVRGEGNVGIGTTTPTTRLSVTANGNYSIFAGSARIGNVATPVDGADAATKSYVDSAAGGGVGAGTTGQTLRHDGSNWVANSNLYNTGTNVGIGTTDPRTKLDIATTGTESSKIYLTAAGTGDAEMGFDASDGDFVGSDYMVFGQKETLDGYVKMFGGAGRFHIDMNTTEALTVIQGGNVGIGTVSPGAKLDIQMATNIGEYFRGHGIGGGSENRYLSFISSTTTSTGDTHTINAQSSTGEIAFANTGGANEWMRIDDTGKVGIGTVSPGAKLDIQMATNIGEYFRGHGIGGGSENRYLSFISSTTTSTGDTHTINAQSSTGEIAFANTGGANEWMRIDDTGNVGIGTASPDSDFLAGTFLEISDANAPALVLDDTGQANDYSIVAQVDALNFAYGSDKLVAIRNDGNVGIGTTTPTTRLSVTANGTYSIFAGSARIGNVATPVDGADAATKDYVDSQSGGGLTGSGTTNYMTKWTGATALGNSVIYNNGANVGIGTTNPVEDLHIYSNSKYGLALQQSSTVDNAENFIRFIDSSVNTVYSAYIGSIRAAGQAGRGHLVFGTEGGAPIGDTITERMRITSDGNVGIGLTNPSEKLEVLGTVKATAFSGPLSGTISSANVSSGAFGSNTGGGNYSFPGNVGIGVNSPTSQLSLYDVNNAKMEIKGSSSGNAKIDLIEVTTDSQIFGVSGAGFRIIYDGGDNNLYFRSGVGSATDNRITIERDTGDVGIGTTNPAAPLHLYRTTAVNPQFIIENTAAYRAAKWYFDTGSASGYGTGNYSLNIINHAGSAGDFGVRTSTSGDVQFILKNDGNVGIGLTNPSEKLHVSGNAIITGTLTTQTGADFAEEFITDTDLASGTVVVMGDLGYKSVKPSDERYDSRVVGIVSDNPAIIAGKVDSEHKAIVAMMGVVTVKVCDQNGSIEKGDLLTTSDLEGYAMKVRRFREGTVIGKALEDLDTNRGEVKVLVNLQ